ncbi:MAG: hypothetical protein J2P30_01630, partial [Actinobacteria bacterium]|nr:hypothetical protein [Actinomycetota bacterium]
APAGQEGPQEGRARPLTAGASAPVPPGPRHARCRPSPRQRAAAAARGFIRGLAAATWDAYMAFLKARQLPTGLPLEPLPPMTSAPAVKATVAPDGAQAGAEPALSYSTPEGSLRALLSDDTLARGMGAVKS